MPLVKSLVRKESPRWRFLKNYLVGKGYTVYPTEIQVSTKHCPDPEKNFVVDVGAFKSSHYYAFEYKSNGDQLLRAIAQVKNYAVSFDYVVVVAQVPRHDISVNLSRGVRIKDIIHTGAGFWTVQFPNNPYRPEAFPIIVEKLAPKLQNPHPENKKWIENKFKRYVWGIPHPEDPNQKQIQEWIK